MQFYKNKTIGRLPLNVAMIFVGMLVGCSKSANEVQMTVDQVDELKGMILKGISISGEIENGCIANDSEYRVIREGDEIHRDTVRILNVRDLKDPDAFDGKAFQADYVTLYIPDGKKGDIKPGDLLVSESTSCDERVAE